VVVNVVKESLVPIIPNISTNDDKQSVEQISRDSTILRSEAIPEKNHNQKS